MTYKVLVLILAACTASVSYADEQCQNSSSVEAILRCAENLSPEIQKAQLALDRAKASVRAAGQWQNPELSADSYSGKVNSEDSSETEISLGIPIELGGKISARTDVAESGVMKAEAELGEARATVRSTTLLKLHRVRQLLHEQELVNEAINTFSKLVSQYGNRFKLSPEQEMTASVFKMAKSDYEFRKVDLEEELAGLQSYFRISIKTEIAAIKSALPNSPKSWPKIENVSKVSNSPRLKIALAELQSATAELSLAQSEAWPTITVGPSVKLIKESGISDQLYGFSLSLPLPIFNTNGGGRAAASAGVKVAEFAKSNVENEQLKTREELVRIYEQSVSALSNSLSHDEIEKKHAAAERLFFKGIVPSALVIEAHRTIVDLEKARNERELKALNALSSLYLMDGKTLEPLQ